MLANGKTDLIEGFKNKDGKEYSCYLALTADGKIERLFPSGKTGNKKNK